MTVPLIIAQLEIAWESPDANLEALRRWLDKTPTEPGTVVILPEMFATGFTSNLPAMALTKASEWEQALIKEASFRGIAFFAGLARSEPDGVVTNDCLLITADGVVAAYEKARPYSRSGEDTLVRPGSEIVVIAFAGIQWCPLICYDLRFPELFRTGLSGGADVFVVIANWPDPRRHHWRLLLQARAIENQAIVVGVNRVGKDPSLNYLGDSLAFGPSGECLFDAGDRCGLFPLTIDVESVRRWRQEFPAVNDFLKGPRWMVRG